MVAAIGVINLMVVPAFANVFKQFGAPAALGHARAGGQFGFTLAWGWAVWAWRRWAGWFAFTGAGWPPATAS